MSPQRHPQQPDGELERTPGFLAYCRPGFEEECAAELIELASSHGMRLVPTTITPMSGFVVFTAEATGTAGTSASVNVTDLLAWDRYIFARQLLPVLCRVMNPDQNDRVATVMQEIAATIRDNGRPAVFGTVWPEFPDTNEGKSLGKFVKGIGLALFNVMKKNQLIVAGQEGQPTPRLHLFAVSAEEFILAYSYPGEGSPWPMGVPRLRLPKDAPSRATLKLEEAIKTFLSKEEQQLLLQPGMTAVDLGAAPGGWSYQLVRRGLYTVAVDNGPMDPRLFATGLLEHRKEDAFRYHPALAVDWLVCDVVEKPSQVIVLVEKWAKNEWMRHAIFNLKLPMKKRYQELRHYLEQLQANLGKGWQVRAKQLYHDRKEVTVYLRKR